MNEDEPRYLGKFDFIWHNSAIGNLGSMERGVAHLKRSAEYLRPGGWLVFTTGVNISSLEETVLDDSDTIVWRLSDIEDLHESLANVGLRSDGLNISLGDSPQDRKVTFDPTSPVLDLDKIGYPDQFESKIVYSNFALTKVLLCYQKVRPLPIRQRRADQEERLAENTQALLDHVAVNADLKDYYPELDDLRSTPKIEAIDPPPPMRVNPGQEVEIELKFRVRNHTKVFGYGPIHPHNCNPTILGTAYPMNHEGIFHHPSWFSKTRPAVSFYEVTSDSVAVTYAHKALKDDIFTYRFMVTAPEEPGTHFECYCLLQEGVQDFVDSTTVSVQLIVREQPVTILDLYEEPEPEEEAHDEAEDEAHDEVEPEVADPLTATRFEEKLDEVLFYLNQVKNSSTVVLNQSEAITKLYTGQRIFVDPQDLSVSPVLMLDGHWEKEITEVFRRFIKPDTVLIDAGANIGYFGIIAGATITNGAGGHIVYVEAIPELCELIRKSSHTNGTINYSTICDKALTDKSGQQVPFHVLEDNLASSSMNDEATLRSYQETPLKVGRTLTVETITLDDLCKHAGLDTVDVIKLDIEGGEEVAYRGMRTTIERNDDLTLIAEFSPAAYEDPEAFWSAIKADFPFTYVVSDQVPDQLSPVESLAESLNASLFDGWFMLVACKAEYLPDDDEAMDDEAMDDVVVDNEAVDNEADELDQTQDEDQAQDEDQVQDQDGAVAQDQAQATRKAQ